MYTFIGSEEIHCLATILQGCFPDIGEYDYSGISEISQSMDTLGHIRNKVMRIMHNQAETTCGFRGKHCKNCDFQCQVYDMGSVEGLLPVSEEVGLIIARSTCSKLKVF